MTLQAGRQTLFRFACWLAASCAALYVFYPGLDTWFFQDDFAWLGLNLEVHSTADMARILFAPMAQGTIRPLSERLFFMAFGAAFGLDALPFRLAVFATFLLDLWLIGTLARRLTGSLQAAFWAPLLWGVNACLGTPLSWTSSYNQIQLVAFLVGALLLYLRYLETGERKWWVAQFVVFLLGFGALELNVAYPVLAGYCAFALARPRLRSAFPMLACSAIYTGVHMAVAPAASAGPYAMHFDARLGSSLLHYWINAFGAPRLSELTVTPWILQAGEIAPWILTAVLAVFVIQRLRSGDLMAAFGLVWFFALLAPVVPLVDHMSYYYLATPTIGLALTAAAGIVAAWRRGWGMFIASVAAAALYVAVSAPVGRSEAQFHQDRSAVVQRLVLGVAEASRLHPGKMILLDGISSDLFWAAVNDDPFRLLGIREVRLTPGSESAIEHSPGTTDIDPWISPPGPTLWALRSGRAAVYKVEDGPLRNITSAYARQASARWTLEPARRIELGQQAFAYQLGAGWYAPARGFRWMAGHATATLGGPQTDGSELVVNGYCPAILLQQGLLHLRISVEGTELGSVELQTPDEHFSTAFPLPRSLVGRKEIQVQLALDRVYNPPDGGEPLGVVLSGLEIRPAASIRPNP